MDVEIGLRWPVLTGIALYMAGMLAVGYIASRRVKTLADFLVAGRRLPLFLASCTLLATWFGAGSCMGVAGTSYESGFAGVIADPFGAGLALIIAGFFYVGIFRKMELLTVTDIFGRYYTKNCEIAASILMVPVYIGWLGSQMVALGFIFHLLTGFSPMIGIVIGAVIVLIYTDAGGLWAVTWTDFIQISLLIAGLVLIFPAVLADVGGLGNLWQATPRTMRTVFLIPPDFPGKISYLGQWLMMGLGTVVGQDLVQRSLASRNISVAKQSAIIAGCAYILIGFVPILIGLAGRLVFPDIADPELIIPYFAFKHLETLPLIIFIAALISAIMSSADSALLAGSSLLANNVIAKKWQHLSDRKLLSLNRWITLVLTVISMVIALYVKDIYTLMVNSWATLFVAIFVPVTAAIYYKRANAVSAWFSMTAGMVVWATYLFLFEDVYGENAAYYQASFYGWLASIVFYFLPLLWRPRQKA